MSVLNEVGRDIKPKPRGRVSPGTEGGATRHGRGDRQRDRALSQQLASLVDQLVAMRLEIAHGVLPRAERISLTNGDIDLVGEQLDAAILKAMTIAATFDAQARAGTSKGTHEPAARTDG